MATIKAPFSAEQIECLNRWQFAGSNHPFTCGGQRTDEHHLDGEGVLMATAEGWKCPYCAYTQDWAPEQWASVPSPALEGSMADTLCGEAARNAPDFPAQLLAAFRAETSGRFRGIILSIIAYARLPEALPLLSEQLPSPDPWLRHWAARGLLLLNVPPD
jgi:hypothetical protein